MITKMDGQPSSDRARHRPLWQIYVFTFLVWNLAVAAAYSLFIALPGYGAMAVGLIVILSLPFLITFGQRNHPDLTNPWIGLLIGGLLSSAALFALVIYPISRI